MNTPDDNSSTQAVPVHGTNGVKSTGTVILAHLSAATRSKRAAKRLALCWTMALFSIVIPGLHFILVPGFLIAGIAVAIITSRERERIAGGEANCPSCKLDYTIEEQTVRWPLEIVCPKCGQYAWIESFSE